MRQRNELARELHDTVGHRVSAIAVQAQAGRALSAADPERALATLVTIEEEASRTLKEMRALVGVLRDGTDADLAPRRGLADIERLARARGEVLGVRVQVSGDVDAVDPAVSTALYLIAAEAVTNATRHARRRHPGHRRRRRDPAARCACRARRRRGKHGRLCSRRASGSAAWPNGRACSAAPSRRDLTRTAAGASTPRCLATSACGAS